MSTSPVPATVTALGVAALLCAAAPGAESAAASPASAPDFTAVRSTARPPGTASARARRPRHAFDLQAHRGGIGLTTESTREAFAKALETGVNTLELDTQVTKDDKVVVSHDRRINPDKCADTSPVSATDPQFPYAGKLVKDLTLAQIRTLNCGYRQLPGFPQQEQIAGARMLELKDVFAVVRAHHATGVRFNIETKVEAGAPQETAPREHFVARVHEEIARSGMKRQVTVQSFDWGALKVMHRLDRAIPLVALTNIDFLEVGKPDYPDRLRRVMAAHGLALPRSYDVGPRAGR